MCASGIERIFFFHSRTIINKLQREVYESEQSLGIRLCERDDVGFDTLCKREFDFYPKSALTCVATCVIIIICVVRRSSKSNNKNNRNTNNSNVIIVDLHDRRGIYLYLPMGSRRSKVNFHSKTYSLREKSSCIV